MHFSLFLGTFLVWGGLSSPLRSPRALVIVEDLATVTVTVTGNYKHGHCYSHTPLPDAGSPTSDLKTCSAFAPTASPASSNSSGLVLSNGSIGSGTSITRQGSPSLITSTAVSVSSIPSTSPPSESATSRSISSASAIYDPSSDSVALTFPSTSSIPTPASGITVWATSLPATPKVGPSSSSPIAPSATTQTYIDNCKSPSASLPSLPTPTDDSLTDWFLYYHNVHRRNHSAPDMVWSTELEKDAATLFGEYASEGKSGHIMGINGDTYGQNLASAHFSSSGSAATYGDYVVSNQQAANSSATMWYHEGDNLDDAVWAQIRASKTNSHFTQMVSKRSTLLGCAVSQSGYTSAKEHSNGFAVACNYGNNELKDTPVTPGLCHPQVGP